MMTFSVLLLEVRS